MWGQWVPSQRRWCVSAPWGRPAPRASQQGLGGASPDTPGRRRAAGGRARGHSEPEEEARGSLCPPRAPAALPRELGAAGGGAPAPLPASPPARCPRPSAASPLCGDLVQRCPHGVGPPAPAASLHSGPSWTEAGASLLSSGRCCRPPRTTTPRLPFHLSEAPRQLARPRTESGCPEVTLGLCPGGGESVRKRKLENIPEREHFQAHMFLCPWTPSAPRRNQTHGLGWSVRAERGPLCGVLLGSGPASCRVPDRSAPGSPARPSST